MNKDGILSQWEEESSNNWTKFQAQGLQIEQSIPQNHDSSFYAQLNDWQEDRMQTQHDKFLGNKKKEGQQRLFNRSLTSLRSLEEQNLRHQNNPSSDGEPDIQKNIQKVEKPQKTYDLLTENHLKNEGKREQERQSNSSEERSGQKAIKGRKKPLKDDYHKNVPNFITKSCIKQFIQPKNKVKIQRICKKYSIVYNETMKKVKSWGDIQTIGLGDLHDMLWLSSGAGFVFKSFFIKFLRKDYMFVLLKARIMKKQTYIEYKNVLLYLATVDRLTNIKLNVKY